MSDSGGPLRSERDATRWLDGLVNLEKGPTVPLRLGLEPARALLERLGSPERELEIVHVAGSKGKGSTVLLAESVLRAAGLRTGVFTSPHLEHWSERFRIDARAVDGARLAAALESLRPVVEELRRGPRERSPTFFDVTTAAALLLFREAAVDQVLLEVGLGGRLDSTNVVSPRVTCITSIELEHTDRLGPDHATIAGEKAGIVKPGVPLVVGALPEAARRVVEERAASLGAPAAWLGRDFQLEHRPEPGGGSRIRFREGELEIEAPLAAAGAHQAHNAALALACLLRAGHPAERIRQVAPGALASVVLPGRAELLRREPPVLVDSAHTEASARALAEVLRRVPRRRAHLVLSISAGKDVPAILAELLPCFERLTITRAEPTRSLEPQQIAAAARGVASDLELQVVPNPHLALRAAAESQAEGELLCVTGSVYLAGIARRLLRDAAETAGRVQVSRRPPPRLVPR